MTGFGKALVLKRMCLGSGIKADETFEMSYSKS